jgi:GNAT superfamily N-acetyltransferase
MNRFRPARPGDVDAIVALMAGYYAQDGYTFIAEEDQTLVGYVAVALGFSFEYRGREAFVDELLIAESHRGRGLGGEALEVAEEYCREQGVNALHLEVERHREKALELYRRRGFEDHNRYLMTKWLNRSRAAPRLE